MLMDGANRALYNLVQILDPLFILAGIVCIIYFQIKLLQTYCTIATILLVVMGLVGCSLVYFSSIVNFDLF